MVIDTLWQFPVKGLGGTTLDTVRLEARRHFPGDRIFAIGNGHAKHDQMPAGSWQKKAFFLQQMQFEQLAEIDCRFEGTVLQMTHRGKPVATGDMTSAAGRATLDAFFKDLLGHQTPGLPHLMQISSGAYTDTEAPLISLGGTASVNRFAEATDTTADARRFRLNIMLETQTPFEEAELIGRRIRLGEAELNIVAPVGRCAAIDVDPATAVRGPHYLPVMERAFGHTDLGIFAEITKSGQITRGDRVELLD